METVLKNTRPTAKQMFLDPRTKIMLCLTVSCVMISSDSFGIMNVVLPCLAAIPLLFLILLKKPHIAAYYAVMYLITATVPRLLMPHVSPLFNLLFTGMIAMFTKLIPGMSMFCLLVLTTTVSEFVAAMDRLHISKKFSVPVSVMILLSSYDHGRNTERFGMPCGFGKLDHGAILWRCWSIGWCRC